MKLQKIIVDNFKSINHLEFDVKKHGKSNTVMFVGINEVGKSNILQAMSVINNTGKTTFNFLDLNNQNNETNDKVYVSYIFDITDDSIIKNKLKPYLNNSGRFLDELKIKTIQKNMFLKKGSSKFVSNYKIVIDGVKINNYLYKSDKVSANISGSPQTIVQYEFKYKKKSSDNETSEFKELSEDVINDFIINNIEAYLKDNEIKVSFWKPEKEYLITDKIDLNVFKDNPEINIPLRNIFFLSSFLDSELIKSKLEDIKNNQNLRRGLASKLSAETTKYVGKVWKHKIEIDLEITENLICNVNVKDKGSLNKDKYFNMSSRSDGFKQFVSLILSLSIENSTLKMKNRLILIDEPENHLHPSGIRDMRDEFLQIGENNYLFLATHSCFMIDRKNKERNYIIKKDKKRNTIFKQITSDTDIYDDEVLEEAFGINVYKDFLSPNKILVEGLSDKVILQKTISKLNLQKDILITNGFGSNIVAVASRLNLEDIKPLVVLDDDQTGTDNKAKIIDIDGIFSNDNVNTIRDVEAGIITNGTIEDTLGKEFVQSMFNQLWNIRFDETLTDFTLGENRPFLEQIKTYLRRNKPNENLDSFLQDLKTKISDEFNPTNLEQNFPLLKSLVEKISTKLTGED